MRHVATPDSHMILSMVFPPEEQMGNKNRRLLNTYSDRIMARMVLIESCFKIIERTKRVFRIIDEWYSGSSYLYSSGDPQRLREEKKSRIRRDLLETKALTKEQIDNILFNLEKGRPRGDVVEFIQKFLEAMFARLKTEFFDCRIYPKKNLFPANLIDKSLNGIIDFWVGQRNEGYRPFYLADRDITQEIEGSYQMTLCGNIIRALKAKCLRVGDVSPDDRRIIADCLMITKQINLNDDDDLCLLTSDELLRLLGAWLRISRSNPEFNIISSAETKTRPQCCPSYIDCPVKEY